MKYLIVEDTPGDVRQLRLKLAKLGFDVTFAWPHEALQRNREDKPEIVQLDGLGGKCFELYQQMMLDNPDATYILYSTNSKLCERGEAEGMKVFDKIRGESILLNYIESFLNP